MRRSCATASKASTAGPRSPSTSRWRDSSRAGSNDSPTATSIVAVLELGALRGSQERCLDRLTVGLAGHQAVSFVTGMMLLVHAGDFVTLVIGLEIISVGLYALAASWTGNRKSAESGLMWVTYG